MLGLVAFCVAVGFGVLVPVLPVFARSFGVGNAEVGAVISAFALMRLISSPFCGWLIKILSERIIMATGIFIVAISSGLAGSPAATCNCWCCAASAESAPRCSPSLPSPCC